MKPNLGLRLRDKLGPDAAKDLSDVFEEVQTDMLLIATERFDARLTSVASEMRQEMTRMDAGLRIALVEGLSKIRTDLSDSRAELLRWSFFFWVGQFSATAAVIGLLWRLANR